MPVQRPFLLDFLCFPDLPNPMYTLINYVVVFFRVKLNRCPCNQLSIVLLSKFVISYSARGASGISQLQQRVRQLLRPLNIQSPIVPTWIARRPRNSLLKRLLISSPTILYTLSPPQNSIFPQTSWTSYPQAFLRSEPPHPVVVICQPPANVRKTRPPGLRYAMPRP